MTASDDGDRLLLLVGVLLAVALVASAGLVVLSAMTAPSREVAQPETDWSVERVNDSHVAITYEEGPTFSPANLSVNVNGHFRHVAWSDPVTPGERVTVRAAEGHIVEVFWIAGRDDRVLLKRWRV